jgi:hypothetical protein
LAPDISYISINDFSSFPNPHENTGSTSKVTKNSYHAPKEELVLATSLCHANCKNSVKISGGTVAGLE